MTLELGNEVYGLAEDYVRYYGDESYFYHLANYLIGELQEQHPDVFPTED